MQSFYSKGKNLLNAKRENLVLRQWWEIVSENFEARQFV